MVIRSLLIKEAVGIHDYIYQPHRSGGIWHKVSF